MKSRIIHLLILIGLFLLGVIVGNSVFSGGSQETTNSEYVPPSP